VGLALERGVPASAVDLGTGSGVMAWLLAAQGTSVVAVDVREEWRPGWEKTSRESEVSGSVCWMQADVREMVMEESAELVVCNPPFFVCGSGPEPAEPWRGAARFEHNGTVADFVRAARRVSCRTGRAVFVVPLDRELDVRQAVSELDDWRVTHSWVVGKRRVLLELGSSEGDESREMLIEGDARTRSWYGLARAGTAPEGS
jgi:tRNA1(Val) A37 N6-methylase TrmN6